MATFNHGKWIKDYKTSLIETKKETQVNLEDLEHTKKWDKDPSKDPKADKKPKAKLGADNDLAIEKDKDGNDVYASGLKERLQKLSGLTINEMDKPVKPFQPGDMWSNDFDYIGMLRAGVNLEIPADVQDSGAMDMEFLEILNLLYESFQDVNYHTEGGDLGNAIEWFEDAKGIEDIEKAVDFLELFKAACQKTLTDITRR